MKCSAKKRYPDKKTAVSAINFAWKRRQRKHRPKTDLRAYHCPDCNSWHLTHKPQH